MERCTVTVATWAGQSVAFASHVGRLTKEKTEGQTAGEKENGSWLCVYMCVCVSGQETHHLRSPWRWCGGWSRGKRLAPRPHGAALRDARSAPTAPSRQGALSGYLWWVGVSGVKRSNLRPTVRARNLYKDLRHGLANNMICLVFSEPKQRLYFSFSPSLNTTHKSLYPRCLTLCYRPTDVQTLRVQSCSLNVR